MIFFFFQAEDGIRDLTVTGVQTCALPIWRFSTVGRSSPSWTSNTSVVMPRILAADRKSTRLNSSHSQISYAVFCLKKKKKYIYFYFRLDLEHDYIISYITAGSPAP